MGEYSVIVILFGIVCFFIFVMLFFINRVLLKRNMVNSKFSYVCENMHLYNELISDMIEFLADLKYEESYVKILRMLQEKINDFTIDDIVNINKYKKDIFRFNELHKLYKKLNKDIRYRNLLSRIIEVTDKLDYSLDSYNREVLKYQEYVNNLKVIRRLFREYDTYQK